MRSKATWYTSFQSHFWRVLQRPPFWNVSSTILHPHLDLRMATQKFLLHHPKMVCQRHTASIWLVSLISLAVWALVLIQAFLGPYDSPSFARKTFLSLTTIYSNDLSLIKNHYFYFWVVLFLVEKKEITMIMSATMWQNLLLIHSSGNIFQSTELIFLPTEKRKQRGDQSGRGRKNVL